MSLDIIQRIHDADCYEGRCVVSTQGGLLKKFPSDGYNSIPPGTGVALWEPETFVVHASGDNSYPSGMEILYTDRWDDPTYYSA